MPHGHPSAHTCIPKLDFITKNWSTSFLWRGLISWGTNFSCTARPNSRICALKRKNPHQWLCLKGVCCEPYITADLLHLTKRNNCSSWDEETGSKNVLHVVSNKWGFQFGYGWLPRLDLPTSLSLSSFPVFIISLLITLFSGYGSLTPSSPP